MPNPPSHSGRSTCRCTTSRRNPADWGLGWPKMLRATPFRTAAFFRRLGLAGRPWNRVGEMLQLQLQEIGQNQGQGQVQGNSVEKVGRDPVSITHSVNPLQAECVRLC
jgi:hypothetical protein